MKTKIRTLDELRKEKKFLQLEIEVTEKLIAESLHFSKENLMQGVADSFFSIVRREPIDEHDIFSAFAQQTGNKSRLFQRLVPLLPLLIKIAGTVYQKIKTKKQKPRSGDILLRKVAS